MKYLLLIILLSCISTEYEKKINTPQFRFENNYAKYQESLKVLKEEYQIDFSNLKLDIIDKFHKTITNNNDCFNTKQRSFKNTKKCMFAINNGCEHSLGLSSTSQGLVIEKLSKDLKSTEVYSVTTLDQFKKHQQTYFDGTEPFIEPSYYFCSAASATGLRLVGSLKFNSNFDDELVSIYKNKNSLIGAVDICNKILTVDNTIATKAKHALKNDQLNKYTDEARDACLKESRNLCQNTKIIKETLIYSYPTKGCEVRDVTVEDIENDIRSWSGNQYVTKGTILQHSQMIDFMKVCKDAHRFHSIKYKAPVALNNCDD
jgi:hypothetical protein